MEFKRYFDINEFWKDNQKLLEEKEWYNCLMIGNCMEGVKNGMDSWLLATVENNSKVELIMLFRKPWRMVMYSPTNNKSDELLKFAATEVYKCEPDLLGVNTEKRMANKFAKYFCELANKQIKVHTPLRILLLEQVAPATLIDDITYRKITLEDKPTIIRYLKEFTKEALHEELSDEKAEEKFQKHYNLGMYVLEKDNKIVVQAGISRRMKYGICVSAVYTPVEERKKSYAYNLVYRISKEQLEAGNKYCVLYTDDANPISNHVYEKIGYKRMEDWEDLDFESNE